MRICLLTTQELDADPFPANDWPCDPRPFLPEATWHLATLDDKETSVARVTALVKQGFDLFFNLCDGAADQDVPGIEVIQTLEALNVPFTGGTSEFYEPTRQQMKDACRAAGIATPDHVFVRTNADIERAAEVLKFPLFVKHYSSYASVDLSRASRVVTPAGLRRQARKMIDRHGAALVEEFIEGSECTVLVAENADDPQHPLTYTPIQYRFPEGESFKHEQMKWVDYDSMSSFPVQDPVLAARLREDSARFFVALRGASFARCDMRVNGDGTPYMLEINPNCGVYYPPTDPGSADICLAMDPEGHAGFTRQLVRAALRRHQLKQQGRGDPHADMLRLAASYTEKGDPIGWFEEFYARAGGDIEKVYWADREASPKLLAWLTDHPASPAARAVAVGCGLGDDAEAMAARGYLVTAFDISESAIAMCRERFPDSRVDYRVADLFAHPAPWRRGFDLVYECNTIQILTGDLRRRALEAIADLVAPGGTLLVSCRSCEPGGQSDVLPIELDRHEIDGFVRVGLLEERITAYDDDQDPPVPHFFAVYRRP